MKKLSYLLKKLQKIKPDYASAWYNKGNSLANLGRGEDAKEYFEKAKQLGLNNSL